jgi:Protein of unknown function (DUF4058)
MSDPVRSIRNQYLGINAHLHSFWQAVGGWSRFHTNHISDLLRTLRPVLLPMGYDADIEPSLQIRRVDDSGPDLRPESDVTIYDLDPARARLSRHAPSAASVAELVLPIPEALFGEPLSEKEYGAIGIYEYAPGKLDRGEPIAWIELLSPSNKPGGRDAREYFDNRLAVLESGLVFIEIDYLHESPSTLRGLPSYRPHRGQPGDDRARAYRIAVIDPRPDLRRGLVHAHEFGVDVPIPTVAIPLSGDDSLPFDFGQPYRKTIEETLYGLQLVNYRELPMNFDHYSREDQRQIVLRMLATVEAGRDGHDLESDPFPTGDMDLDTALARLAAPASGE